MNRTPWYPGNLRPVRVGWYERLWGSTWIHQFWWDGFMWRIRPDYDYSNYQYLPWRGLTAPHGESK